MKSLFKSLIILISTGIITSSSFSQTVSREVLIEDTLYHFELNYNMIQKLVDSTSISSTSVSNQELFKTFARQELSSFFMTNFNKMLANTINSSHLQGEYDDHFNSLKRSASLMSRFSNWKINQANHSHTGHSHGADAGNCDNVDFELGTWQHWNPFRGDVYCPAGHAAGCVQNITAGTTGTGVNAQHRIVTGGNDVDVAAVPRLNPRGGSYSIMLGDENGGGEVSMITHVAKITALKPYFTYDFAVVFNDPSHPVQEQPFFDVQFLDSNGVKIPSCGNYFVITGAGIPGFITTTGSSGFGTWRYKPWTRITVDLSNYIGQDITVKFTVGDCGYGGHDGRAYVDGSCFKPEIQKFQDCKGINLLADSGYLGYQWYGGSPLTILPGETKQSLTIAGPGIYQVKLISESGCTLYIDTLINDIYVILNQNITQVDPSCIGVNDGKLTINAYGGQAPYTYSIDGGTTIVGTNNFTGLAPGSYTCIVYDSGGCSDTLTYTLTNPPDILANLVITDALCFNECNGNVVSVPSGGTSPTGAYRVEFDNVFAPTKQRSNFCAGPHNVKITDENGCSKTYPFVVAEPAAEVIDAIVRVNEQCFNDCSGSITVNDATAVEYSVDDGSTWQASNIFNNLCAQAGPYAVAIRTANGCIGKRTEPITQPMPLVMTPIADEFICLNKFATKRAIPAGGTPPYSYKWSDGTTSSSMVVSPPVSTTYTATVTDANGCEITDEFNINLHPQPNVNFEFTPGPETDVFNTKVEFTNTTVYGANLDWEWYIHDLATYNTRDAYYEFPTNGGKKFINCLKAQNEQGCRDSICKVLYIKYEVLLYVPNTFTPNGDDLNDNLIPVVEGLKTEGYKMYVFNRWGELMYSTTDQTEGWDGTYQGKKVDEGAYIWRVVGVTKQTDEEYEKFGHVTILKKL